MINTVGSSVPGFDEEEEEAEGESSEAAAPMAEDSARVMGSVSAGGGGIEASTGVAVVAVGGAGGC